MKIYQIIFFCLCFIVDCPSIYSIPATPFGIKHKQEDGTYINVRLKGDENFHIWLTEDGIPIKKKNDSYYYYINEDQISQSVIAHDVGIRKEEELMFLKKHPISYTMSSIISTQNHNKSISNHRNGTLLHNNYVGNKKVLVILVEFKNCQMSIDNPQKEFEKQFNEVGYSNFGHIGSVRDYFYSQSYGIFNVNFDIVGPVQLSKGFEYYGENSSIGGKDANPDIMVREACNLVNDKVNFKDYDWNQDGEVEQILIVYAGFGEAFGATEETIWPHTSKLSNGILSSGNAIKLDGVTIDTYACSCELSGTSGNTINGIGTICHEFSHCLGLPDLYNTNGSGGYGVGLWDIMGSGSYSGPTGIGEIPCGYSAYERYFLNWLDIQELNTSTIVDAMPSIGEKPIAYKIVNNAYKDEFFVVENRQNTDWFSYTGKIMGCHGLLITHVDYDVNYWHLNKVNCDELHQRVAIIPADNSFGELFIEKSRKEFIPSEEELKGDLFPGNSNITSFTFISHKEVGGKLFHANAEGGYFLNNPISDIYEQDGLISFN